MRLRPAPLLAPLFAVALLAASALPDGAAAQQAVTLQLGQQNESGMTGTATLTPMGGQTQVVLQLQNAPGPHPAHIHSGACPQVGAVVFPLTSVSNGRSETMVSAQLSQIQGAQHAINVHKSPQEASVYTACGNIAMAGAAAASGAPSGQPAAPAGQPGALPRTGVGALGLQLPVALGLLLLLGGGIMTARRRPR